MFAELPDPFTAVFQSGESFSVTVIPGPCIAGSIVLAPVSSEESDPVSYTHLTLPTKA